jgi:hypothetical protein
MLDTQAINFRALPSVTLQKRSLRRSVEVLAGEIETNRFYWHDIEAERIRDALPEDTLRKIERVLGVQPGYPQNRTRCKLMLQSVFY